MKAIWRAELLGISLSLSLVAQVPALPASLVRSAGLSAARGSPYAAGVQPRAAATGDFNADGLPDLVLLDNGASGNNSTLTVLLATRDGAFVPAAGSPILLGFNYTGLAVGDFNHDGKPDIATTSAFELRIWLSDGTGRFSLAPGSPIDTRSFGGAFALAVGDFNRDGRMDLAVVTGSAPSNVAILLGNGDGRFNLSAGNVASIGKESQSLTVADYNRDGNLDVAVTLTLSNQVAVFLGDGTGRLIADPNGPFSTGFIPLSIASGDINRDGKVDLVVANQSSLSILLGDGSGSFVREPEITVMNGFGLRSIAVADLDGDGIPDLAIANANSSISNVLVLIGDGNGGFQLAASGPINSPGTAFALALADFNNDGRLDIAVANADGGTASIFLGSATVVSSVILIPPFTATVALPSPITMSVTTSGYRTATGTVSLQDAGTIVATAPLIDGGASFQATLSTAGVHKLTGIYSGDPNTAGSTSPEFAVTVSKGSQLISFPSLPRHTYGEAPFPVTASSTSGLPVTIVVSSGPATIAGNVLTLTGAGLVTLQASQAGDANYLPALSVVQQVQVAAPLLKISSVVNAASYGGGALAADSYAVLFGADLASPTSSSGGPSPALGGASIQLEDAAGNVSNALLYYADPAQINFLLPSNLSPGKANLTLTNYAGLSARTTLSIAPVSPGIFSADATGTGVAAGAAVRVSADGRQTLLPINSCNGIPLVCTAFPIDLGGSGDTVFLSLYGTGIRGRIAISAVTATIGGVPAQVFYAGPQPDFPGLDQINLQVDGSLRGRGAVFIVIGVDNSRSNVVTVAIQ